MNRSSVLARGLRLAAFSWPLWLAACGTPLSPADYSAGYRPLALGGMGSADGMPDACLRDDVLGDERALLPAGCANALNLRDMVVTPGELSHGTAMGPGMAAPVGQAIERYLQPGGVDARSPESGEVRRLRLEQEGRTAQ